LFGEAVADGKALLALESGTAEGGGTGVDMQATSATMAPAAVADSRRRGFIEW
jgi:hypothetical protein